MASPVVGSSNTSSENTDTTTHTISLPTGITSGNTLIAIIAYGVSSAPVTTWPSGWTEFFYAENGGSHTALVAAWRKADGTEGSTIAPTSDDSTGSAHIALRITGAADPTVSAPESATGLTGTSNTPDPPSLTPSGGSDDYLWIAALANRVGTYTVSAYPASYTDNNLNPTSSAASSCAAAVATRGLTASSEDPAAFTVTAAARYAISTFAVYPGAAAGTTIPVLMNSYRQRHQLSMG